MYLNRKDTNKHYIHPIDYFNKWFAEPIAVVDNSVAGIIDALNRHPIADDTTAQDYVMPISRCRELAGRFRIYGENQDVYYCFVNEGDEYKTDPPVYFESCLDLKVDYGFDDSDILNNDCLLVADRFSAFLWQMLGHHICLRMESSDHFSPSVNGILFGIESVNPRDSFINPLGREFPAGFTCLVADDAICIPDWGCAFLTSQSRDSFMIRYSPIISEYW
jgi:hypothetical protein